MLILKNGRTIFTAISLLLVTFGKISAETKTVLITGANRGLGLELAKQFIADGHEVIGTARKPEKATDLKALKAEVVQLDVTSEESIESMVNILNGKKIDILINNAGYFGPKLMTEKPDRLDKLTRKEMELCIEVNTLGPLFVTQALVPNLKKSPNPVVVNMSTRSAILNARSPGRAYGYRVSKTALNMVTRTMAGDPTLKGFIVISLAPGHNKTDMGTHRANLNPEESMPKVKNLILTLTPKHHGGFWFYDGSTRPW
jgi:NAD(P)-dependent dehydrogenase (short-subunit alcohol dehydrogenase family)